VKKIEYIIQQHNGLKWIDFSHPYPEIQKPFAEDRLKFLNKKSEQRYKLIERITIEKRIK